MSVSYFLHTPLPDDSNEWRAVSRLSRLMQRHFAQDPNPYSLIFNIEPDENIITAEGKKLTQLDALLFGPKFVAIIEFKNCFEPVQAESLKSTWHCGDYEQMGGSAPNPFLQVQYARHVWTSYLAEKCAFSFPGFQRNEWQERWEHLSVFLLFVPYLHPDSALPPLEKAEGWLSVGGISDVAEIAFSTRSERLGLSPATVQTVVTEILGARLWPELDMVRDEQIGNLFVAEPNRVPFRMPLYRFDDISIGRSTTQLVRVHSQFRRISGAHARIEVQNGAVKLLDAGSKNGTFVNGTAVDTQHGTVLGEKERALLGAANSKKAVQIWYTFHTQQALNTADTKTLFGTIDTQES